jgi:hypothetical protein
VWNRVLNCDVFVWLDHVKFSRSSTKWEDRTVIEGRDGRPLTLRLPLRGSRNATWGEAGLNDGWQRQARSIQSCYSRAPHWPVVEELITPVYDRPADTIDEVCWRSFDAIRQRLQVSCEVIRSGSLPLSTSKGELVLDIVQQVGGTHYLSGLPGMSYLPVSEFEQAGVAIEVQDWSAPVTRHGLANPSVLHLLAHDETSTVRAMLQNDH